MEKVVCAAIKLETGRIFTGMSHSHCIDSMSELAREGDKEINFSLVSDIATQLAYSSSDEKFGFLTNTGRFLTRMQSKAEFNISQSFEIRS